MKRRTFLVTVSGGVLAAPLAAEAQPAGKVPRLGFLFSRTLGSVYTRTFHVGWPEAPHRVLRSAIDAQRPSTARWWGRS